MRSKRDLNWGEKFQIYIYMLQYLKKKTTKQNNEFVLAVKNDL